jgi:xanthine dehydrogenase accessory factor
LKEIRSIITSFQKADLSTTKAALAVLIRIEGSSYRRTGARMLVFDDGSYTGGISGGCLEGDALRKAQKAIMLSKPSVVTYDTMNDDAHEIGVGLGCNGIIDVLFIPLDPSDIANPVNVLAQTIEIRRPVVLITVIESLNKEINSGKTFLIKDENDISAHFPEGVSKELISDFNTAIETKRSSVNEYQTVNGKLKLFVEVISPVINLIIYGSNYDIYPLMRIAKELGWNVAVVMNAVKANKLLYSIADKIVDIKAKETLVIDEHTAILLMSHDLQTDLANLKNVILNNSFYIGILGPKKRFQKMMECLKEQNFILPSDKLNFIFSPAGLDIGAKTPEEIALSITAEIISISEGKNGTSLKDKQGTIHERNHF